MGQLQKMKQNKAKKPQQTKNPTKNKETNKKALWNLYKIII